MKEFLPYMLPLTGAATGWAIISITQYFLFRPHSPVSILGISFQGVLPAAQQDIARSIALMVTKELKAEKLTAHLVNEDELSKLTPSIEKHIDTFLSVKLNEKLPILAMYAGPSTMQKIKEGMMEEIELLLPDLIRQYAVALIEKNNPGQMAGEKLMNTPFTEIEQVLRPVVNKLSFKLKIFAAATGFIAGIVQYLLVGI